MKIKNKRLFWGVTALVVLVLAGIAYFIFQAASADTLTGSSPYYNPRSPVKLDVKLSETSTQAKAAPYTTPLKADLDWSWNQTKVVYGIRSMEVKFYCTDQDKIANIALESKTYEIPRTSNYSSSYTGQTSLTTSRTCSYGEAGVHHPYVTVTANAGVYNLSFFHFPYYFNAITKYATISLSGDFLATLDVTDPTRLDNAYAPFKTGFAVGHSPAIPDSTQPIYRTLYCNEADTEAAGGNANYPYSLNPKIFSNACTYETPGTYRAKAVVKRNGVEYIAYKSIVVKDTPTPTPTPTASSTPAVSATPSVTSTTTVVTEITPTPTSTATNTSTPVTASKFALSIDVDDPASLINAKAPYTTGFKVSYKPIQPNNNSNVSVSIFCQAIDTTAQKSAIFPYKSNPQTYSDVCTYDKAGTYTARVIAVYNKVRYYAGVEIVVQGDNALTQTVTVKKGFNIFGTDEGTVSPNAFSVKGLTTFGFNVPNTAYGWISWPPSQKLSVLPGRGYYVYNPGNEVTLNVPISPITAIRRVYPRWNLLYTSTEAGLGDIPTTLVDLSTTSTNTTTMNSRCLVRNKTLQELMDQQIAYKTVFVIDNPQATKACQSFKILSTVDKAASATCSDNDLSTYGTVKKIPAGKAFWIYLWPSKVTGLVASTYKSAQAEESASDTTVSSKCINTD